MNYREMALQFLESTRKFRKQHHQKKIEEKMKGEAYTLLYMFMQKRSIIPGELSCELSVSSARAAAILNGLEDKGFITRQIDKADRRRILVTLTAKGRVKAREHYETMVEATSKMLQVLGEDDTRELVRIVGRMAELTSQMGEHVNSRASCQDAPDIEEVNNK